LFLVLSLWDSRPDLRYSREEVGGPLGNAAEFLSP